MPSTKAYSVGLVALSFVAVLFAGLWLIYWDAYKNMLNRYEKLLDEYGKLLNRYADTLISLGKHSGTAALPPGYYLAFPMVIPIDDVGFVDITVISKQSSVKVYIVDYHQYTEWCASKSFSSYYLYREGSYIDSKVMLRPGVYFVVIINPDRTPTSISYTVKTMYKSLYDWVLETLAPRDRGKS
jgi:hypothetical protein